MDKRKEAVINLDFPVQLADRELTQVTMRRVTIKDMITHHMETGSGLAEEMELLCDLTGLNPSELERLDLVDYEKLQQQLLNFRGVGKSK